jgi:hypothetical protein
VKAALAAVAVWTLYAFAFGQIALAVASALGIPAAAGALLLLAAGLLLWAEAPTPPRSARPR